MLSQERFCLTIPPFSTDTRNQALPPQSRLKNNDGTRKYFTLNHTHTRRSQSSHFSPIYTNEALLTPCKSEDLLHRICFINHGNLAPYN
jgi:hypothetical protein